MKFRQYHLSAVLKSLELQQIPLDAFLSHYFRSNKALGSKDRQFIGDTVYHYIRWKNLFDHLGIEPCDLDPTIHRENTSLPIHVRHGMPEFLFQLLVQAYGEEKTKEIALISNTRAPTTIRINPLKTTRDEILAKWSHYKISPCPISELGIQFHERINFFTLPEFKEGFFEIQDEASQLAAELVLAKPKQHVLDYCAGAGGKTLAFAHRLENRGQIYLYDIRTHALEKARIRLRRAGIQNAQFNLPPVKKSNNWVIVDVPCSGTGTLRRNPDLKWKFTNQSLASLQHEQRQIFSDALSYLHPSGHIVYMTCSLLPQENEEQIAYFEKEFALTRTQEFKSLPTLNGMDGFYAVTLKFGV
jgi:16S rRNA C967 or C1407 C5-methylase (RsmB/RsmF family)